MKVGEIKGIEIDLHSSVLIIVGLVGFYAAELYYSLTGVFNIINFILVGLINGLIILGSIIAHELMHSIISLSHGLNVSKIDLYLFGGVSNIEEEPKTPQSEIMISVVGPAISLLIGVVFLVLYYTPASLSIPLLGILAITLWYSGISNIVLGIFNLIPAFPMDGGRILRAYLWNKRNDLISATETAANVGYYFGWAMVGYGLIGIIFMPGIFGGFWFIILGFFLSQSSRQALKQTIYEYKLSKISVREIQNIPAVKIPHDIMVSKAISDYFMKHRFTYFPVIQNEEIIGLITIKHIKDIPLEQRSELRVEEIMGHVSQYPSISEEQTAKDAFQKLQQQEEPKFFIVKRKGTITGFIGQNEIRSSLRLSDLFLD